VAAGPSAQGVAVDPTTGIVAVGQVGGADLYAESGRHLAVVPSRPPPPHRAGGARWALPRPAEASSAVAFVDEPGGSVAATVATGRMPHDLVDVDGTVFVGNEHDSTMTVIRQQRVIATVPVAEQPGGLTVVGPDVAVVSVRARRLQLFDATSLRLVASVPIQGGPSHVAAYGSELYVVDTGGTHLRVFDTAPRLHLVGSVSVPRSPLGVAVDPVRARLWITCTATNRLVELSLARPLPRIIGQWPPCASRTPSRSTPGPTPSSWSACTRARSRSSTTRAADHPGLNGRTAATSTRPRGPGLDARRTPDVFSKGTQETAASCRSEKHP